ncbi:MAG: EFR1 family ferrodoxin [Oxalobacter sp.]|nr:EFR1 family ferrodoxin [Oxalobacter sp.]
MQFNKASFIYFSATGTTRRIVRAVKNTLPVGKTDYNLLRKPVEQEVQVESDNLMVVAMPVYNGRIPALAAESLRRMRGQGTPAIAIVVYGNREYDDALLEVKTMLEEQGFFVLGAAAFIARHSIFPEVANERPDADDLAQVSAFTKACVKKLADLQSAEGYKAPDVRGNIPFMPLKTVPMKPSSGDDCDFCGICEKICPVQAITIDGDEITTDPDRCISCGACISVCPIETRHYRGADYEKFRGKFIARFGTRRENETYL